MTTTTQNDDEEMKCPKKSQSQEKTNRLEGIGKTHKSFSGLFCVREVNEKIERKKSRVVPPIKC